MRVSNATVRRRIFIILIVGVVLYSALVTRLGYVQLIEGPKLSQMSDELLKREIKFQPNRGRILDRSGNELVTNMTVPTLVSVGAQIKDPKETARQLAVILEQKEEDVFRAITKKEMSNNQIPGGRKLSVEKARKIQELNLPGIYLAGDTKRFYPNGNMAAHILGFTGIDNQGLTGLEKIYDPFLMGTEGHISFPSDAKGRVLPGGTEEYVAPVNGMDMYLTLDSTIQSFIERELDQAVVAYQPDDVLAIAMNPKTGEILGMGSRPTFQPDAYRDYPSEVYNRNLPIWKTYEPGSTFKIVTLAAALNEGVINLNEGFYDPGFINVAGKRLRCWKRQGHGQETMLEVVENSCNPGFVTMGQRLQKERLFDYIKKFGFGQKTGIDLIGEENGLLFNLNKVGPVELGTTSFGQGVSVTPIQQMAAVSAAINGGKLMKPFVAKEWRDSVTHDIVARTLPTEVRQVITEETSAKVRHALESVVAQGTGNKAYIEGYRVGGKTGTAQKVKNGRYVDGEYIVSFIGFAPADDPQIVVYFAVDNPKALAFGGLIAAPSVKSIMESSLQYLNVPKRKDGIPKEINKALGERAPIEVPNMVGQSMRDVVTTYDTLPLVVSGKGQYVIQQSPAPGVKIDQGGKIRIYLGDKSTN
ncbi:stage V sporulation protein D [Brevibacillus formosus]|uniref:Stage V sporulation protein D n=1 Tax=Brevibacillus formosus TaxID=54913 RepID=A0A837KV05_9BACL|nr:stage V sporulation protein D [Brevibacillus formosus]KLI01014.1 stage V sporulation protein D [Brevibacillus formosus]MED1955982.1 stage V sporulation protein D [Brevibacillus formosus]PSK00307.1 stage V sporulation protein D [Brevibacillus formosus]GED60359.1 stage V sporulation protein D [Brevibacillus formosus]